MNNALIIYRETNSLPLGKGGYVFGSVGLFVLLSVFGLNIFYSEEKDWLWLNVAYNTAMSSLSFCLLATLLKLLSMDCDEILWRGRRWYKKLVTKF